MLVKSSQFIEEMHAEKIATTRALALCNDTYLTIFQNILKMQNKQTSLDRFILKRPASESRKSVPKKARVGDAEENDQAPSTVYKYVALTDCNRRKLSQLRTNKSPLLMTYLHKIDPASHPAANCPLCNDPNHDSLHLFKCPDIPTTLTVWDLWTDPVGVAALLDVWGEKLGGPRAGV